MAPKLPLHLHSYPEVKCWGSWVFCPIQQALSMASTARNTSLKLDCSCFFFKTQPVTVTYTQIWKPRRVRCESMCFSVLLLGLSNSVERSIGLEKKRERTAVSCGTLVLQSWIQDTPLGITYSRIFQYRSKISHLGNYLEEKLKLRTLSVLYSYGRQTIRPFSTPFPSRLFYGTVSIERWEIVLPKNIPFSGHSWELQLWGFSPLDWRTINVHTFCKRHCY